MIDDLIQFSGFIDKVIETRRLNDFLQVARTLMAELGLESSVLSPVQCSSYIATNESFMYSS